MDWNNIPWYQLGQTVGLFIIGAMVAGIARIARLPDALKHRATKAAEIAEGANMKVDAKIAELEQRASKAEQEHAQAQRMLAQAQDAYQKATATIQVYERLIDELQQERVNLLRENDALKKDNRELKVENSGLKTKISELEHRVAGLEQINRVESNLRKGGTDELKGLGGAAATA